MENRDFTTQTNDSPAAETADADAPRSAERLKLALRRARVDDAERTRVVAELRGAEIARLEMLRDELLPVAAEIPKDADLFDIALVPSERPRLFVDMIGFVEMGRDRRTYRFVQDTRHGRVTIAESERLEPMVEAIADYIARRLIEREKALSADSTLEQAARAHLETQDKIAARHQPAVQAPTPPGRHPLGSTFVFLSEFFGSAVLFAFVALGAWTAWKYLSATYWIARHSTGH